MVTESLHAFGDRRFYFWYNYIFFNIHSSFLQI